MDDGLVSEDLRHWRTQKGLEINIKLTIKSVQVKAYVSLLDLQRFQALKKYS